MGKELSSKAREDAKENKLTSFIKNRIIILSVAAALLAIAVVVFVYVYRFHDGLSYKHNIFGEFGDFFGGTLNPIFGFLTIIILVITLTLQRDELKVVSSTAIATNNLMSKQVEMLRRQSLENTFFKALSELKEDAALKRLLEGNRSLKVLVAMYSLSKYSEAELQERGFESPQKYFAAVVGQGCSIGEFNYAVGQHVIILCKMANQLENNYVHYALIRSSIKPPLLSAILHCTLVGEGLDTLIEAKRVFDGVNTGLFYEDALAELVMSKDDLNTYKELREQSLSEFDAMVEAIEMEILSPEEKS